MDDFSYRDSYDEGVYGTGPLRQRKNNTMLITVLLVIVIFLCGVVSILSILNIRLFQALNRPKEQDLAISYAEIEPETSVPPTKDASTDISIDLSEAPLFPDTVPEEGGLSLQEIYSRNAPAVVSISTKTHGASATGSGVIFSADGYIITNHHVVADAATIIVKLSDDREMEAVVIGQDEICDLAVLQVSASDLTPAKFGDSNRLRVGDTVVAIGDPLGENFRGTMTNGIISAINRDVALGGMKLNLIQTNAALNSGNSGGPLINCYGQVVGINTMKIGAFSDVAGVEGIGFALPSTLVKDVAEQLISQGFVSGRPTLGIEGEALSKFYQRYYHLPAGLYITRIDPEGPCAGLGLTQGDILLKLDGVPIFTPEDLNSFLFAHEIGDSVTLEIFREGKIGTGSAVLAEKTT